MNTHFHFVLQTLDNKNLSDHIAYLKWHYTLRMRREYGWKGPLWRERYKSLRIENESYLTACGMYVEYNPVRAGSCKDPLDYPFSSCRKTNKKTRDDLVDDYEHDSSLKTQAGFDYQSISATVVFSRSPAIGSPFFVEEQRNLQNGCPKK